MAARPAELTLFAAVPAARTADGRLLLDDKFASGMALHAAHWPGPVRTVMRELGKDSLPFAHAVDPASLNFEVTLLAPDAPLEQALGKAPGIILASADMPEQLSLGAAARARGLSVVFGIEYTLRTRLQIVRLERGFSRKRKLWSMLWNLRMERKRRAALRAADGIEMNGFPAEATYAGLNAHGMRYLDNRMSAEMLATPAEMDARRQHHSQRRPLRLINSGRLEALKGADLLVPLATLLHQAGVPFTLDIYGAGSLEDDIRQAIAQSGLGDQVHLHQPVPFETGLVPISREAADVFVSCHVQSDPSCTYIEAMGCGLPVVGFGNQMLAALVRDSQGGWCAPMGNVRRLAELIAGLARDRDAIMTKAQAALDYARRHDFHAEFDARMRHLAQVVSRSDAAPADAAPLSHGQAGS